KSATTVAAAVRRVAGDEIRAGNSRNIPAAAVRNASGEATRRFPYRRIDPCAELLRNGVFPKFVQIILKLAVRVKEPGTYRPFGNLQDLTDLGMGHPLNMEHGDHSSVFIRQLHHGLVQSSLELRQVSLPDGAAGGGQFEEFFVVLDAGIHII